MTAQTALQFISCHPKLYGTFVRKICVLCFCLLCCFLLRACLAQLAVQNCRQKLWLPSSAPLSSSLWAKTIPDLGHSPHSPQLCYRISFYRKTVARLLLGLFILPIRKSHGAITNKVRVVCRLHSPYIYFATKNIYYWARVGSHMRKALA